MTKAEIVTERAKQTGIVPAHSIPFFKPSGAFKDMMAK